MIDFRKSCLALTLISAALGGCSGGGDDGSAVVVDPEPLPPPAATPAVNAGDDQNVIEDDLVSLEATTSGFSGNASLTYNWRRVDGPYMIFSDASVANPKFVAPDVASEQQISLEVTASDGTTTVTDTLVVTVAPGDESPLTNAIFNGELSSADYWDDEPKIFSAGMGFDNIIGVNELTEEAALEAGGAWYESVVCTSGQEPSDSNRTSMATADGVRNGSKGHADFDDGLPIVFSWPVATETADVSDFQFMLNTGEVVFPNSVTLLPNWELNERNTIVVFGDFGNRGKPSESDAVYPVRLDIVEDATPLLARLSDMAIENAGLARADKVRRPVIELSEKIKPASRLAQLVREVPELRQDLAPEVPRQTLKALPGGRNFH